MATFTQRITDLIGSEYTDIASLSIDDLFNAATNEVADMLPTELLLKYCATKTDIDSGTGMDATEERKVLLVVREINDSDVDYVECKPIPYSDVTRAKDSDSLYFATAESPVYTYDGITANDIKLKVFPVPTAAQLAIVWSYLYATGSNTGNSAISGLPDMCLQAVVLKACINILQAYISNFVQDEEDNEMLGMLNAQIQSISALYTLEINRFKEADATPRGE